MKNEKSKPQAKTAGNRQAQKLASGPGKWITPGAAEGDLETVEEDLQLQERKKKAAPKEVE